MTYPAVPLGYRIEVAPTADTADDPDDHDWVDVTADLAAGNPISHKRGSGEDQGDSSSDADFTFRNPDRRWSTDNPLSDMWPGWRVDCPIRCSLSLDGSSTWSELWTQYAAEITDIWGGTSARLPRTVVRADGLFRRLGQGDALRSAMFRTMAGISDGDFAPVAYWPLEDATGSTQFASAIAGHPAATLSGDVSPASFADIAGSDSLPTLGDGGSISARVPAYTGTGVWQQQFATFIPMAPSADADFMNIYTLPGSGSTIARIRVYYDDFTDQMTIAAYDGSGALLSSNGTSATYDTPVLWAVTQFVNTGNLLTVLGKYDVNGFLSQTNILTSGNTGAVTEIVGSASSANAGWTPGHWALYTDPAVVTVPNIGPNAAGLGGHDGEMAHERIARILRELRIPSDITATRSTRLGPQRPGTALDVLRSAEEADHGQLDDSRGRVAYRALSELYNQTAALTIDAAAHELGFPLIPVTDDQKLVNKSTVTRTGGSSATVDRRNGAAERVRDAELNLYDDTRLADHASFYVSLGEVRGKRVAQISINFAVAPQLAAAFLALRLGDRVTVVNCPLELSSTGTLDLVWVGWSTGTYSRRAFWVTANCAPYAPYAIGRYGSTTGTTSSKYGAKNTTLNADITASATSVVVASGGDKWATTASHSSLFPAGGGPGIGVEIGGLTYLCTAITGTGTPTYTLTLVRLTDDKPHSAGDPVKVVPLPKYGM